MRRQLFRFRGDRRSNYLAFALVALGAAIFILMLLQGAFVIYDFATAPDRMSARYQEATEFIRSVYRFRDQHSRWPSEEEVRQSETLALPQGWSYAQHMSPPDAAWIALSGPHHIVLVYHFPSCNTDKVARTWTLSFEGDKSYFDVPSGLYSRDLPGDKTWETKRVPFRSRRSWP